MRRQVIHDRTPATETHRGEAVFAGHLPDPGVGLRSQPGDEDFTVIVLGGDGQRYRFPEFTGRADFVRRELRADGARHFRDVPALIAQLDQLVRDFGGAR
jgi:hypothetical protein